MATKHGKIIKKKSNNGLILRLLDWVEHLVNKLPDPFFIFIFFSVIIIFVSYFASAAGVFVVNPGTGEKVFAENLLSLNYFVKMHTDLIQNFVGFPPLGVVFVALIGISVADHTGFIGNTLKWFTSSMPDRFLTAALIFASVNGSIIADAGFVLMPAIGAALFAGAGRHPIAGLVAGMAGLCGGFSANILLTALDPLLSAFTDAGAKLLNPEYDVYASANYFFMLASTFVVTAAGVIVNNKFVEPRIGKWNRDNSDLSEKEIQEKITSKEKKAIIVSLAVFILIFTVILLSIIPENGFMRGNSGSYTPFYKSLIAFIVMIFLVPSIVYGYMTGSIKKLNDISNMMSKTFNTMGPYILLAFAAGQFIAYFNWSNLGIITAVNGAEMLKGIGLQGIWLMIGFLTISAFMNIFIYSASAKWALFAPVFVPMFMLLDISPEMTQLLYRMGDSITNMITPLLPYFPIVLAFAKKYDKDITFGKLVSSLLPYSVVLYLFWLVFLVIWYLAGLPIGPGAEMMMK
jgi:aminobenzoyl-glutamate transport protein